MKRLAGWSLEFNVLLIAQRSPQDDDEEKDDDEHDDGLFIGLK